MKFKTNIILLGVFLLELAASLYLLDVFRIKKIVSNNYYSTVFYQLGNQNYWTLDRKKLAKKIKSSDPQLKEIKLHKSFPDTLRIKVKKREKEILVTNRRQTQYYWSDLDGVIFAEGSRETPLLITGNISLKPGLKMDDRAEQTALKIIRLQKDDPLPLKKLLIKDEQIQIELENQITVLFPIDKKSGKKVKSLQLLLKKFTMEGRQPNSIDLRYKKPVVKF